MQNVPVFKFDNLDQKQDNEPDRIDQSVMRLIGTQQGPSGCWIWATCA